MPELNAVDLNNWIVKMKPPIQQARFRLRKQLKEKAAKLQLKKASETEKAKNGAKAARLLEEVAVLKEVRHRDVSKFAVVNVERTLNDLKIKIDTPASDRALWKLALSPLVQVQVDSFRELHSDWATSAPFLLQRLGAQYRDKKKADATMPSPAKEKPKKKGGEKKDKLKKPLAKKADNEEPTSKKSAVAVVESARGPAVVRRIDLDRIFEQDEIQPLGDGGDASDASSSEDVQRKPSSSFFVGGESSDEEQKREPQKKRKLQERGKPERGPPKKREKDSNGYQTMLKGNKKTKSGKDVPEVLHPSWEAKRAKKASEAAAKALVKSVRPTKHTFADDSD